MKKSMSKFLAWPWHPLILGVYPVLALYAQNIEQARADVLLRPLVISFAFACTAMILFRLLCSDWPRAAFCASALILLFFSYGHVYNFIEDVRLFGILLGRHRFLLMVWTGLAVLAMIMALRKKTALANLTAPINTISIVLLLFPAFTILSYGLSARTIPLPAAQPAPRLAVVNKQSLPDVYYIILDSYTRSDVLKKVYGYDNSAFLNDLKQMGFYVAECSTSNYMWTRLSISSTLNMGYLQDNADYLAARDKDVITEDLLKHSLVRRTFESIGYKTVAFATGFPFNEVTDADVYLEPPSSTQGIREFEALLAQTTLLRVLQDFGYLHINQTASANFRERTLFDLSEFDKLPRMGGPKFVYIHIITPHPPFVFGPQGESIDPKEFRSTEGQYTDSTYFQGYVGQVQFISDRIDRVIRKLVDESPIPPIIIVQGDHGPWKQRGENRVSILNAYYLPGHPNAVSPDISPVNSFRVIFNEYFQANYSLLDNISYRSPYANIYDFTRQPTSCKNAR